jgi:hypothetical protein
MRILLSLLIAALVLSRPASRAATPDPERLVTKLIENVSPSALGLPAAGTTFSGLHDPAAESPELPADPPEKLFEPLPDQPNGGKRYDVMKFMVANGIPAASGKAAIYLENERALVLTATAADHDLAERILEEIGIPAGAVKNLEFSLSAWTYLDDPLALVHNKARNFDDLRAIAGDSLVPIDSRVIVTRSGNRATSVQELAAANEGAKVPAATDTSTLKTPGSTVAVEPVLGPDAMTIDFQLEYRARIPQAASPDLCFSVSTNASIADGKNLIVQSLQFPPVDGQNPAKVRRCAIVIGTRILEATPSEAVPLTGPEKEMRDRKLIADAFAGLPKLAPKPAPRENSAP